jgi:hypothetical protein
MAVPYPARCQAGIIVNIKTRRPSTPEMALYIHNSLTNSMKNGTRVEAVTSAPIDLVDIHKSQNRWKMLGVFVQQISHSKATVKGLAIITEFYKIFY